MTTRTLEIISRIQNPIARGCLIVLTLVPMVFFVSLALVPRQAHSEPVGIMQDAVRAEDVFQFGTEESLAYIVRPGVELPEKVEKTVAEIAEKAQERIGRPIVVTSASRSPQSQAAAMRTKLELGDNVMGLYRDKKAAGQIVKAYRKAKKSGANQAQVTDKMANVIANQVSNGVYLSRHLHEGAVDLRTVDLSATERKQLLAVVKEIPSVTKVILESTPPHLHIEIE